MTKALFYFTDGRIALYEVKDPVLTMTSIVDKAETEKRNVKVNAVFQRTDKGLLDRESIAVYEEIGAARMVG